MEFKEGDEILLRKTKEGWVVIMEGEEVDSHKEPEGIIDFLTEILVRT